MTLETWTALHDNHHIGVKFSKHTGFMVCFSIQSAGNSFKNRRLQRWERYFWVSLKPATHVINKSSSGDFRATDAHGADLVSEKNSTRSVCECVCTRGRRKYVNISLYQVRPAGWKRRKNRARRQIHTSLFKALLRSRAAEKQTTSGTFIFCALQKGPFPARWIIACSRARAHNSHRAFAGRDLLNKLFFVFSIV